LRNGQEKTKKKEKNERFS